MTYKPDNNETENESVLIAIVLTEITVHIRTIEMILEQDPKFTNGHHDSTEMVIEHLEASLKHLKQRKSALEEI